MAILKFGIFLRKKLLCLVGMTLFACMPFPAYANDATLLAEGKIKAGLVYNFLKYTSWPSTVLSQEHPVFHICLLGGDSFEGALHPLQGRTAQQYKINIRLLHNIGPENKCHVLYIHQTWGRELEKILKRLEGKAILTMSDIKGFARRGGMVELSRQPDKRIHLYINRQKIRQSRLQLEDHLAKLAKMVK